MRRPFLVTNCPAAASIASSTSVPVTCPTGPTQIAEHPEPSQHTASDVEGPCSTTVTDLVQEQATAWLPHPRLELKALQLRGLAGQQIRTRRAHGTLRFPHDLSPPGRLFHPRRGRPRTTCEPGPHPEPARLVRSTGLVQDVNWQPTRWAARLRIRGTTASSVRSPGRRRSSASDRRSSSFATSWSAVEPSTRSPKGPPGLSRALTKRLRELERAGVVEIRAKPGRRGSFYELSEAGRQLWDVMLALQDRGLKWAVTPNTPIRVWCCGRG